MGRTNITIDNILDELSAFRMNAEQNSCHTIADDMGVYVASFVELEVRAANNMDMATNNEIAVNLCSGLICYLHVFVHDKLSYGKLENMLKTYQQAVSC